MNDTQVPVVAAPQKLSRRFFPFSTVDKVVGLIFLSWALVLRIRFGQLGLFGGLTLVPAALWSLTWGKTYDRVLTRLNDASIKYIDKGVMYQNVPLLKKLGEYVRPSWWRRALQAVIRRRDPYPIRVDSMQDDRYGEVGLGYNMREKTDSVVFLGPGSDIARKDAATQSDMLANLASSVRRLGFGLNASVTFIARPRPAAVSDFDIAIDESHHPEATVPSATLTKLEVYESTKEWVDPEELYIRGDITPLDLRWYRLNQLAIASPRIEYQTNGRVVDFAFVITVPRDTRANKAARRWRPQSLTPEVVRSLPITRTLKMADDALHRLGVEGARLLNREELEEFCMGWKPVAATLDGVETGVPRYHPQCGVYGSHNAVEEDGVISTTFKITEMPAELGVSSIAELFTSTTPAVTLAVTGENSRGRKEGRWLYLLSTLFDGLTESMRLGKSVQHARANLDDLTDEIARTKDLQYMTILLRVANTDPEQHADDSDTLVREVGGTGFLCEPPPGASLQYTHNLAATTGMVRV